MLVVDDDDDDDMFMCLCIQLFVYISSQNNMILMRSHRRPYSAETMTLKSFIASGKLVKNSTSNTISSDLSFIQNNGILYKYDKHKRIVKKCDV